MKRFLSRLIVGVAFMSMCLPVFSQVKLSDSGVTKFYDNGTRITYFKVENFPNSAEMRDYVTKIVLENPDINRVVIYVSGKTIMYEALQSVEPDMMVDAVNEALEEYKVQNGDFPPSESLSTDKPRSNVIVKPHKASSDVKSQSVGDANQKYDVTEEKLLPGAETNEHSAKQAHKVVVDGKEVGTNSMEMATPANNNTNSKKR